MFSTTAYLKVRPFIRTVLPAPVRACIFSALMFLKDAPFRLLMVARILMFWILRDAIWILRDAALHSYAISRRTGFGAEREPDSENENDLRHRTEQAIIALGNVDIEGCIRNAMPGATLRCKPGDIGKLRIKEACCYYLGVASLQGRGRLDEAIFWWREQRRIAEGIARQNLRAAGLPSGPDALIFDRFWSAHVGHTAMLGIHVKRNLLEGAPYRPLTLLRTPPPNRGNDRLVQHWQEYFTLADRGEDPALSPDYLWYGSKSLFLDNRLVGPETYFWRVYAEISKAWDLAGGGALLELSSDEIERGRLALEAMGVPRESWYVCLHVRASGFKPVHEGLQSTLNADITSYDQVIDAIVSRGGWVIRMGDRSMPKLPGKKGVVDYAHSPQKADWMDLFLCGTCRFYIGTSSGLAYVPNLFGTPCVFTNWFPTGTRPLNSGDIFIPKMHWYDTLGAFATFAESLAPPLGHIHVTASLAAIGVTLKDNTPEDLRDVVEEMLERLESEASYFPEDDLLQARFDAVANNSRSFGNARIGRDFLRKYRDLLPSQGTELRIGR